MENLLLNEADRCLLCKNPKCSANCHINTPIPDIIKLYKEGKLEEAGKILFENNPLSAVYSLVCIHEDQCKGNCIRGIKGEPIRFHDIENEISEKYLNEIKFENLKKDKDRVAIVGGGPAGITIAFILANRGYNVTIFDAHVKLGGVLRYGIPEYRLPKKLIDTIEDKLLELGVKIRPNTLIGPVISLDRLFEDGIKFELFKSPLEITEEEVKVVCTENVVSVDGKVTTKVVEGKTEFFKCDSTIIAVSQSPRTNIVSNTTELDTNKWGLLVTDDKGNTTKKGTFALGDVVTGAKTVVEAVVQAKVVAETIDEYCKNN